MSRPRATAVVFLLAATALTGCGASERNDYVDGFNEIQRGFGRDVRAAARIDAETGLRGFRGRVVDLADSVERSAARMRDLDAPDDVRTDHNRYVAALREYAGDLRKAARRVNARRPAASIGASSDVVEATDEVSRETARLTERINKKL